MKISIAVLACALLGLSCGAKERIERIGLYDWAVVGSLGANVTFNCELYGKDNGTTVSLLPNGTSVSTGSHRWLLPGATEKLGPIYNKGNMHILGDKLTVENIDITNKGIFHCYVELDCKSGQNCTASDMWFKHGLNLNGPLYDNLLEKYRMNFITAGASSGGVLGLLLMFCLIYKFRFKDPLVESAAIEMHGITPLDAEESSKM